MTQIFLDTGYVLAVEVSNDQHHVHARDHWNRIVAAGRPNFITTSYVFSEVITYLNSRGLHDTAIEVGEGLIESPTVRVIHVDERLFDEGWQFLQRHRDKTYSLADCISFVVMKQFGITTAYSFDHHFRQAGFNTEP